MYCWVIKHALKCDIFRHFYRLVYESHQQVVALTSRRNNSFRRFVLRMSHAKKL